MSNRKIEKIAILGGHEEAQNEGRQGNSEKQIDINLHSLNLITQSLWPLAKAISSSFNR